MEQAGFARSRLARNTDDLAETSRSLLQRTAQFLYLGIATDKPRQATSSRGLQTGAHPPKAFQFVRFDRFAQAFKPDRPKRPYIDVAFD